MMFNKIVSAVAVVMALQSPVVWDVARPVVSMVERMAGSGAPGVVLRQALTGDLSRYRGPTVSWSGR